MGRNTVILDFSLPEKRVSSELLSFQLSFTLLCFFLWVSPLYTNSFSKPILIFTFSSKSSKAFKRGLYLKPSETTKILSTYLSCHNFFSLSSVQIIIVPFLRPASSKLYISGGVHRKKKIFPLKSQLRPLATFVPSLGRVGQCAWELCCSNIRKCFFWSDPCVI